MCLDGPRARWNNSETSVGNYVADQLVISAGGWAGGLVPELELPLTIERQAVFWLEPSGDPTVYDAPRFPIYAYEYKPGSICYGFPRLRRGVKAAAMHDGEMTECRRK